MLTEEQRKELFNNVVPFVTDDVFSEYCSTKLQNGMCGVEGNIRSL